MRTVLSKWQAMVMAAVAGTCVSGAWANIITWNGASAVPTANWSDTGNWVGGVAPVAGDSLVFDVSAQSTSTNDLAVGTSIAGITVASTIGALTVSGNAISLAGDFAMNRASTFTNNVAMTLQQNVTFDVPSASGSFTQGGAISGTTYGITKTGSGLMILGSATYGGGTTVAGGTLRTTSSGNTSTLFGSGGITLSNGGNMDLRSTSATTFDSAATLGTAGGSVAYRGNGTFSPSSISGAGSLGLTGDTTNITVTLIDMKAWGGQLFAYIPASQTMFLRLGTSYVNNSMLNAAVDLGAGVTFTRQAGTNTTTVVTDIGRLSGAAGSSFGGSAAGSGYFTYSIGSRNEDSTFAGNLVDGSTKTALRKVGSAKLTLTGPANTITGPSAVNNGSLVVNGALTASALALTVNTGGTLAGTGSIAGSVGLVGGTIAPGDGGTGTLSVNNAFNMDANTIAAYDLNGGDTTAGGGVNDLVTGVTNLKLDGTLNVQEAVAGSFATATSGSTWRLFSYTGTLTDNGLLLGTTPTLPAGGTLSVDTSTAGQVNLVLTVANAPEPATLAVMGVGMGLLGLRRRNRR